MRACVARRVRRPRRCGRRPRPRPGGRPGNSPWITHSLNGSVGTGASSTVPVAASTEALCSSVVAGVMRSTIVVPNATLAAIQPARPGSTPRASSATTVASTSPLWDRLSQETMASVRRGRRGGRAGRRRSGRASSSPWPADRLEASGCRRRPGVREVEVAVRAAPVAGLGDGGGHQRQTRVGRSSGASRRARPRPRGRPTPLRGTIAVRRAHQQRVQPVLGGQLAGRRRARRPAKAAMP